MYLELVNDTYYLGTDAGGRMFYQIDEELAEELIKIVKRSEEKIDERTSKIELRIPKNN